MYIDLVMADYEQGTIEVSLLSRESGECLFNSVLDLGSLPATDAGTLCFPQPILLNSQESYAVTITNLSAQNNIKLRYNNTVQSGKLLQNGQQKVGFLNLSFLRTEEYEPSALRLILLVLVANVTILTGLALVLFCNVQEHVLYLVLAIGFGIVTLFDLTPLYGFDMRFQFDSSYVVSNWMLGEEGTVETTSLKDPEKTTRSYYRRAGDDYSQYQFYHDDSVSDNYTDTAAGLKKWKASPEDRQMVLVEADQGIIGEQLYLYLPQAIGFTIARLLHWGMFPMLQLARILNYACFVFLTYCAIRNLPFGKRIMLILALVPSVLIQTVSITRDALIFGMAFFVIGKVMQLAYAKKYVSPRNWAIVLLVSALLAPCKMVYLPISFFWLLIIYRHNLSGEQKNWKLALQRILIFSLIILLIFILTNIPSIINMTKPEKEAIGGQPSYTISHMLKQPKEAVFVIANTFRQGWGEFLMNALQLFDIRLGSTDGMTLILAILLFIESCFWEPNTEQMTTLERVFMALVICGVATLVSVAAMGWTPLGSDIIVGLQGRYFTPIMPLICLLFKNNRIVHIEEEQAAVFVKAGCCLFPALMLLNMYMWTVAH